jgi:hypothetical protein
MSAEREELRSLVEQLPDGQVAQVLRDVRRLLPLQSAKSSTWPPAWFAIAEGSAPDVARRSRELLAEGFGRGQ